MKIALTGSTGFIGGQLCRFFAKQKEIELTILARSKDKVKSLAITNVKSYYGDINDLDLLKDAFKGQDIIIHLAALFNHPEYSWDDYRRVNVKGTSNVLQAAHSQNVRRVVYCSTIGVAASDKQQPFSEKTPYSFPAWDKYETTKCEAEKLALDFCRNNNLEVVVIRPAQVYGPCDQGKAKFYRMVKKGIIVNPGQTKKHLIYIDDLCRAFQLAAEKENLNGEVFIIAGQHAIFLRDLISIVAAELHVNVPWFYIPALPMTFLCGIVETLCNFIHIKPVLFKRSMDFFIKSVEFNISKAKKILDFQAQITIHEGVSRTAKWYIKNDLL